MKESANNDYTLSESEAERPRKRARVASESHEPPFRQILLEEIDLEVALRQRLASTIESRITWALLLQETLTRELNLSGAHTHLSVASCAHEYHFQTNERSLGMLRWTLLR